MGWSNPVYVVGSEERACLEFMFTLKENISDFQ